MLRALSLLQVAFAVPRVRVWSCSSLVFVQAVHRSRARGIVRPVKGRRCESSSVSLPEHPGGSAELMSNPNAPVRPSSGLRGRVCFLAQGFIAKLIGDENTVAQFGSLLDWPSLLCRSHGDPGAITAEYQFLGLRRPDATLPKGPVLGSSGRASNLLTDA